MTIKFYLIVIIKLFKKHKYMESNSMSCLFSMSTNQDDLHILMELRRMGSGRSLVDNKIVNSSVKSPMMNSSSRVPSQLVKLPPPPNIDNHKIDDFTNDLLNERIKLNQFPPTSNVIFKPPNLVTQSFETDINNNNEEQESLFQSIISSIKKLLQDIDLPEERIKKIAEMTMQEFNREQQEKEMIFKAAEADLKRADFSAPTLKLFPETTRVELIYFERGKRIGDKSRRNLLIIERQHIEACEAFEDAEKDVEAAQEAFKMVSGLRSLSKVTFNAIKTFSSMVETLTIEQETKKAVATSRRIEALREKVKCQMVLNEATRMFFRALSALTLKEKKLKEGCSSESSNPSMHNKVNSIKPGALEPCRARQPSSQQSPEFAPSLSKNSLTKSIVEVDKDLFPISPSPGRGEHDEFLFENETEEDILGNIASEMYGNLFSSAKSIVAEDEEMVDEMLNVTEEQLNSAVDDYSPFFDDSITPRVVRKGVLKSSVFATAPTINHVMPFNHHNPSLLSRSQSPSLQITPSDFLVAEKRIKINQSSEKTSATGSGIGGILSNIFGQNRHEQQQSVLNTCTPVNEIRSPGDFHSGSTPLKRQQFHLNTSTASSSSSSSSQPSTRSSFMSRLLQLASLSHTSQQEQERRRRADIEKRRDMMISLGALESPLRLENDRELQKAIKDIKIQLPESQSTNNNNLPNFEPPAVWSASEKRMEQRGVGWRKENIPTPVGKIVHSD